jgi:hypothetical protein|tara:strand:+ start:1220 stop:1420 length:201 start_codon:yes stop_codon:yes gene_type:complete
MKEALDILDQIEEQVNTCCAITMFPEDVVELIDKLRTILKKEDDDDPMGFNQGDILDNPDVGPLSF